jgi:integrase
MARMTIPLSVQEIKSATPREKAYKLFDGEGLYLEVPPKQRKRWRLKYRFNGKEKLLSLGNYPDVSLKSARNKKAELKELIASGIDPSQLKKEEKELVIQKEEEALNTFESSARAYIEHLRPDRNEAYWNRVENAFERDIFPIIGKMNMNDIKAKNIIQVLQAIQNRGAIETANRLFSQISNVFKYAVSHEKADRNPCNDMDKKHILKTAQTKHYATITEDKMIGKLLYDINKYTGDYLVRMALSLAPYVAVRPYNIRYARWADIDFDTRLWRIPLEDMKTDREHLIPLTDTTIKILQEVQQLSGEDEYVFPSSRNANTPFGDTTLNKALRRMGYTGDKLVTHGFRAMFSTIANEQSGFRTEVIEVQLAHNIGTEVSRAYNRALYLQERKDLMQWWSDYLDEQKRNYIKEITLLQESRQS